ncbi:N-6 DNA methylase [Oligella sp. HMSC09E12]|uniref:N-6 DNA methylase n=1 Tax=Oligella sp. HMSC09E12 TaxID=1581147 RepID=UPI0008A331F6|nr:N-6 DNA methylase [Oligella sp. HMSC09E12]OFV51268.1 hypothetical protein HMPREF3179_01040 [Oligella sp. HMSC09E12]
MKHTIKSLREQFKAVGKFHTPPELALMLRSYIPDKPNSVYDPTCGAGALLSVFGDDVIKYGQDIDADALADAELLPNFNGYLGDVLTDPAWLDKRFSAIVANPPFSIEWQPKLDERFISAPTIPTASRADYAFLLHILHMLDDNGTAVVLSFPGVLYRGNREAKIRAWLVETNVIDRVVHVPANTFIDTPIATAVMVLKKGRQDNAPIAFEDTELGLEKLVPIDDVRANDYTLSVSQYVQAAIPDKPSVDPWELEQQSRMAICGKLRSDIEFSKAVARIEGWAITPFINDLQAVLDEATATLA